MHCISRAGIPLARRMIRGGRLEDLQDFFRPYTQGLTGKESDDLIRRIGEGSRAAREEIAHQFVWMAVKAATRAQRVYSLDSIDLDDLIGFALLYLARGIHRIRPGNGAKAGTYLWYWIRRGVQEGIRASQFVSLSRGKEKILAKARGYSARLRIQGIECTTKELADHVGLSESSFTDMVNEKKNCRTFAILPGSADNFRGKTKDHDASSFDPPIIDSSPSPVDTAISSEETGILRAALGSLTEREQEVMTRRYGICKYTNPQTLDVVGEALNLSRERIRQIEKVALSRLREVLKGKM